MVDDLRFISKMDSKGRVTVPQVIRESLGLYPGTYFEVMVDVNKRYVILKPVARGLEEGVVAEVMVKVKDMNQLVNIVTKCINEGYDIMRLNCIKNEVYECVLNVYAIDVAISEKLKDLLSTYEVVSITLHT